MGAVGVDNVVFMASGVPSLPDAHEDRADAGYGDVFMETEIRRRISPSLPREGKKPADIGAKPLLVRPRILLRGELIDPPSR